MNGLNGRKNEEVIRLLIHLLIHLGYYKNEELNDDENIFAYQIDALTGIVVCENECGLAYCRSCFDYRVPPTIEELR